MRCWPPHGHSDSKVGAGVFVADLFTLEKVGPELITMAMPFRAQLASISPKTWRGAIGRCSRFPEESREESPTAAIFHAIMPKGWLGGGGSEGSVAMGPGILAGSRVGVHSTFARAGMGKPGCRPLADEHRSSGVLLNTRPGPPCRRGRRTSTRGQERTASFQRGPSGLEVIAPTREWRVAGESRSAGQGAEAACSALIIAGTAGLARLSRSKSNA